MMITSVIKLGDKKFQPKKKENFTARSHRNKFPHA